MLPKTASDIPPSEITPQSVYLGRRKFLACGFGGCGWARDRPDTVGVVSVAKGAGRDEAECPYQEPLQHQRKTDVIQRRDSLQQLLLSPSLRRAKCYFHCRMDSTVGRQTLADAASPGISGCQN